MTTLDAIRDLNAGAAYPGAVLEGCETALILFAAGFLGKQDAYWIAEAGMAATCVDVDAEKLAAMATMYPQTGWQYVVCDVYLYAQIVRTTIFHPWDVVSLDPWTQDFQRCADHLATWCALARKAVILGTGWNTNVEPPEGWRITDVRKRSEYDGGVYWTVLEPVA